MIDAIPELYNQPQQAPQQLGAASPTAAAAAPRNRSASQEGPQEGGDAAPLSSATARAAEEEQEGPTGGDGFTSASLPYPRGTTAPASYSASETGESFFESVSPTRRMMSLPSFTSHDQYSHQHQQSLPMIHQQREYAASDAGVGSGNGGLGFMTGAASLPASSHSDEQLNGRRTGMLNGNGTRGGSGSANGAAELMQANGVASSRRDEVAEEAAQAARESLARDLAQVQALLELLQTLNEEEHPQEEEAAPPSAATQQQTGRRVRIVPVAHQRTPSNAAGLTNLVRRKIETVAKIVECLRRATDADATRARASAASDVRKQLSPQLVTSALLPNLSDASGKELRAHTYRAIRAALVHPASPFCHELRRAGLHLYLERSLLRDRRFEQEKEQAICLIRAIVEVSSPLFEPALAAEIQRPRPSLIEENLDLGVFRFLAAIAEQPEDRMRSIVLETLTELAVLDGPLLARANCVRPLIRAVAEGGAEELAPLIMRVLTMQLDSPATRTFLQAGVDLDVSQQRVDLKSNIVGLHADAHDHPTQDCHLWIHRPPLSQLRHDRGRPARHGSDRVSDVAVVDGSLLPLHE